MDSNPPVIHVRVVAGRGGGPEKTILNSPRYLAERGFESVCVYLRDPDDSGFIAIEDRAAASRAELLTVDDHGPFDFGVRRRLSTTIDGWLRSKVRHSDSPWIYHGHDYKTNLLGLRLRRQFPAMCLVTTVHGWVQRTWKTPLYYAIDRRCLPRYEKVVCVSPDLEEDCRRHGVADQQLMVIDNAIALDDYDDTRTAATARVELGLPDGGIWIAGVGRLSAEKGFERLIDAVVRLRSEGNDLRLMIAGDGDARESLQQQIDDAGANDAIHLLGYIADPRSVYRAADLFVLSSLREGLPNVVLEAMAMRTPVMATPVAGMPRLIDDGVHGRLLPPPSANQREVDTQAIADGLRRYLASDDRWHALSNAAHDRVSNDFSFASRMDKMVDVYQSLFANRL